MVATPSNVFAVLRPAIPNAKIELAKAKWRALVVEVGAMGSLTGISSIVASVIGPLANCGVSVFCLSTNLDDFVLVRRAKWEIEIFWFSQYVCCGEEGLELTSLGMQPSSSLSREEEHFAFYIIILYGDGRWSGNASCPGWCCMCM